MSLEEGRFNQWGKGGYQFFIYGKLEQWTTFQERDLLTIKVFKSSLYQTGYFKWLWGVHHGGSKFWFKSSSNYKFGVSPTRKRGTEKWDRFSLLDHLPNLASYFPSSVIPWKNKFVEESREERVANVARNQRKKSMRGEIRIVSLRLSNVDLKTKQQTSPA